MERFLNDVSNWWWWVSVVFLALLINITSQFFGNCIEKWLSLFSSKQKKLSKEKKEAEEKLKSYYLKNKQELLLKYYFSLLISLVVISTLVIFLVSYHTFVSSISIYANLLNIYGAWTIFNYLHTAILAFIVILTLIAISNFFKWNRIYRQINRIEGKPK